MHYQLYYIVLVLIRELQRLVIENIDYFVNHFVLKHLQHHYFQTTINPFGTLYNPASISEAIRLAQADDATLFPMVEWGGLWHSMTHHGVCSNANKGIAFQQCMASIANLRQALREASVIVITFGTAWIYEYSKQFPNVDNFSTKVVANCHKMPADRFVRRCLSVQEIVDIWQPIIQAMPDKHWIFTVSPIRYLKDGLHANQISKAILLQAIDHLTQISTTLYHLIPSCTIHYFPSYEIMMDELRDYRFYAEDMVHPSPLAVEYIWQRFVETYMSAATRDEMHVLHQLWRDQQHRFLHPDTPDAQKFADKLQQKKDALRTQYPWIV